MRGPGTVPSSMARLSPKTGPPMSRTDVTPRISMFLASAVATTCSYPAREFWRSAIGVAAQVRCA